MHQILALPHNLPGREIRIIQIEKVDLRIVKGQPDHQGKTKKNGKNPEKPHERRTGIQKKKRGSNHQGKGTKQGKQADPKREQDDMIRHIGKSIAQVFQRAGFFSGHVQKKKIVSSLKKSDQNTDDQRYQKIKNTSVSGEGKEESDQGI